MKLAKHRNWYFSKDEIQWQIYSEKYVQVVREMQMKPQWGSPNSSENGLLHESIDKNCWRRCGENGSRIYCWWEHKLVQTLQKSRWRLLRQLEYRPMVQFSHPTPGLYTNKMKYAKELTVINLTLCNRCSSTDEWINWHIYMIEYLIMQKDEILLFTTKGSQLETIILSKISQSLNDTYHMFPMKSNH